jgi:hypothetical protein
MAKRLISNTIPFIKAKKNGKMEKWNIGTMEKWNPDPDSYRDYRGKNGKEEIGSEQPAFVQSLAEMVIKT